MIVLRTVGDYQLNKGTQMAKGLYNVTDQVKDKSLRGTAKMRVSNWFDAETKNELIKLSAEDFKTECETLLKQ